jgi:hypothetical protein
MSEQQVIGGFEPNDGNSNPAFKVITRKRTNADNAWEGLKGDGVTEYHVYDKHWSWVPATPTLETMLAEWRDLEARAQAVQAEADALFEHAGQCHGEIVVRLAELGWGAPRMVPGEPVVTLDDSDGWIKWEGGERPVPGDTIIDVEHRDGDLYEGTRADGPYSTDWDHADCGGDIVAYRLTPSAQQ